MSRPSQNPEPEPGRDSLTVRLAESGRLPDPLLRLSIRRMCAQRLRDERKGGPDAVFARQRAWMEGLLDSTAAVAPNSQGRQNPALPLEFFRLCLGKHLKYSACLWEENTRDLTQAEEKMLRLYCERAELRNGQRILELGCGWGSLTLWMAERYPQARITAVTGSAEQRAYIEQRCRSQAIFNVDVLTADVNQLNLAPDSCDRVVSVELFEHMRNYPQVLSRIAGWLSPGGKLFVQLFCHRELLYLFESQDRDHWLGRHFFTGGLMPAADTLLQFQDELTIEERWLLPGTHYEKTANAWLQNQDANQDKVMAVMRRTYGAAEATRAYQRSRMFWMACAELFGYSGGHEWMVAHYRFRR